MILFCWTVISALFLGLANADSCPEPEVTNGQVSGRTSPNFFYGQVRCHPSFHLVGNPVIKCRAGTWSGTIPVCAAIGTCPALSGLRNGRNIPIRGSRQSAVRFACFRGFRLVGEKISHCMGERWSGGELPLCVRPACDESGMADIPFGEAMREEEGALYRYECDKGVPMEGSSVLYCDGKKWNGTVPSCLVPSGEPTLEVGSSGTLGVVFVLPGYPVQVNCHATSGNPVPQMEIYFGGELVASNKTFAFKASGEDDGKEIKCVASNKAGRSETIRNVSVIHATISGPTQAAHGDTVELSCILGESINGASFKWISEIDGLEDIEADVTSEGFEEELNEATVDIKIDIDTRIKTIRIHCIANIEGLGLVSSAIHEIKVIPLPVKLTLIGIREGSEIEAGEPVLLTCSAESEYDSVADLTWLVDGELAGEGSDDMREAARVVSNWRFSPELGNSVVECRDWLEGYNVARVTFTVVERKIIVTLAPEQYDDEYLFIEEQDYKTNQSEEADTKYVGPHNTSDAIEFVEQKLNDATQEIDDLPTAELSEHNLDIDAAADHVEITTEIIAVEQRETSYAAVGKKDETVSEEPIRPEIENVVNSAKIKESSLSNISIISVKSSQVRESSSASISSISFLLIYITIVKLYYY